MIAVDLRKEPDLTEFIDDQRLSLNSLWKEHCASIGKTSIFLTSGAIVVGFLNTDAVAILFFSVVCSLIAMRINMPWVIFPLVGFYGASINYDGNPLDFTLISIVTCLAMAWFMCQWMISLKIKSSNIKEKIKSLTFSEQSPNLEELNDQAKKYCKKVMNLGRQFTYGELEIFQANEIRGEVT